MLFEQRAKYAHALAGSYGNPATATWAAGSPSLPDAGPQRSGSGSMSPVRTRSSPSPTAAGEAAERDPNAPQSDEDIIMVTVRLSNKVRRGSYDDPLPERYVVLDLQCMRRRQQSETDGLSDRGSAASYAG